MWRIFLDLVILVLSALRLVRLVTVDDLSLWLLRIPFYKRAGYDPVSGDDPQGPVEKLVSGLECPFCVGFWLGIPLLLAMYLTGGPGSHSASHLWWEYVAGAFALNYLVAHVASRLDT